MQTILVVVHLLLAVALVGLVLIQHGKGADMGAAFGSGASATVFGSAGAGNFLSRTTGVIAALFFVTSLTLAYFAMQKGEQESLMKAEEAAPPAAEQPAAPTTAPEPVPVPVPSDVPDVPEAPQAAPAASGGDVPKIPE